MEGKVTSELDGSTDTTATEAVNERGAAKAKVVGRADDNRGDRRVTETENGRDSDVADNEPRHTTEAMHRKEGPNIKLNNNINDRDAGTKKKTTNVANLQRGCKITAWTQTQKEVSSKTRERARTDNVSNHYGDKGQVGETCMGHGKAL